MKALGTLVVLALASGCAAHAARSQPSSASPEDAEPKGDPVLGMRISQGLAFGGQLWLRGGLRSFKDDSGGLVSLDLADLSKRQTHFARGTLSMTREGRELRVLRYLEDRPRRLVLSTWDGHRFSDSVAFDRDADEATLTLVSKPGAPLVLSTKFSRTLELQMGKWFWKAERLPRALEGGVQTAAATPVGDDVAYVGFNRGEFGGALQRVDVHWNTVVNVDSRKSNELCDGPFNPDCDPITGVIAHPTERGCVLASIGLIHFGAKGRILKVCGTTVSVEFEQEFAPDPSRPSMVMTTPIFGLQPGTDDSYWAYSHDKLFRFRGASHEESPLPKPEQVGGLWISRALPGVILVLTDINWAVSVSGYTPLVIPLDER